MFDCHLNSVHLPPQRREDFRTARQVVLAVPAHQGGRMYVYHAHDDEHGLEDQVSVSTLVNWLRWLVEDD